MGVAPTMKPVFRSCDVLPAFAAAMQTMAPTQIAIGEYMSPVQPRPTNSRHVRINVAIVMPEIGLDEVPMSPVMRDETVAKKKPKIRIRIAASALPCVGKPGAKTRNRPSSKQPTRAGLMGKVRLV